MPQTDLLKQASYYSESGYSVFKLVGKEPVKGSGNWRKTPYLFSDELSQVLTGWNGNIGIPLTSRDLVIDIDPRNFKENDKPHLRLFKEANIDIKLFGAIAETGGGGIHIYLRLPQGDAISIRKKMLDYPGVDFLSVGCYVVGVGSVHPTTGKNYRWVGGKALHELPACPMELIKLIQKQTHVQDIDLNAKKTRSGSTDGDPEVVQRYQEYLKTAPVAVQGQSGDQTTYSVACKGRDYGLSQDKVYELMLKDYNHRCIPDWKPDELKFKVRHAFAYAKGDVGNALAEADFKSVVPENEKHPLFRGWDRYENGKLQKTLNNVFNYFIISDSPFKDSLAYDEFNAIVKIQKRLPWHQNPLPPGGSEWRDDDSVQLRLWLSRERGFDVQVQVVDQAVLTAAQLVILHPVKDYLCGLRWDGKSRLESWLIDHAGAQDNKFVREASKKFLLQAVSRVYQPGCKADHIIVLEGAQGVGKSSLVEILGGQWYGDIVIDPHSRDTVDAMRGKWFIEFSEMEVVNRHEAQALKAFITRRVDRVRLAYGRRSMDLPRQCVFMGTMNPDATGEYLSDSTGNRRVWPIAISRVNFKGLMEARDQLFAEAADLVLKGEATYIIDREVEEFAIREQRLRQTSDPWGVPIQEFLEKDHVEFTTTKDIWVFALKGSESVLNNTHQRRIAACLKELDFIPHVKRDSGRVIRGYLDSKVKIDNNLFN